MRRNIFDLMKNEEIDVEREYIRIHKLFEKDTYYTSYLGSQTMCNYVNENFFTKWSKRGRNISVNDMFTSLDIRDKNGLKENTIENLLLYIEVIINLISISNIRGNHNDIYHNDKIYCILNNNINELLEDLNYEIKELSDNQLIIVEKDMLLSAVAETNKDISDSVIEYRRFILKGKINEKKDILNSLANTVEGMKLDFKGTTYSNLMDDVQFMLNNLNIRHNNVEGKNKKDYVVNLSKEELEQLYDQTFDMILGLFVIDKYIKNKNEIDSIKKNINQ